MEESEGSAGERVVLVMVVDVWGMGGKPQGVHKTGCTTVVKRWNPGLCLALVGTEHVHPPPSYKRSTFEECSKDSLFPQQNIPLDPQRHSFSASCTAEEQTRRTEESYQETR